MKQAPVEIMLICDGKRLIKTWIKWFHTGTLKWIHLQALTNLVCKDWLDACGFCCYVCEAWNDNTFWAEMPEHTQVWYLGCTLSLDSLRMYLLAAHTLENTKSKDILYFHYSRFTLQDTLSAPSQCRIELKATLLHGRFKQGCVFTFVPLLLNLKLFVFI